MRYTDDVIEEVRSKNDILDVVSQYVKLTRKGSSYAGLCPFHNEKTASFYVTPSKQMYYCFGCGAGGNVFNFIMQYENASFTEALERLADRAGVTLPKIEYSKEAREKALRRQKLLEINKAAAKFFYFQLRSEQGKEALAYLTGRGLSDETIRHFGLGFAGPFSQTLRRYLKEEGYEDELLLASGLFSVDERRGMYDKFWNRVMFPIMDVSGRVIGFGGRVMGEGKPKYLNSPETEIFDKGRNLYGLHAARTTRENSLILCEGYMDVIAMHQAGFTQAVASLGTALTSGHASLLRRYTREVLLIYDSDNAGVRAALRAIPILREAGITSRVVSLSPYKDPDEFIKALGADEFKKRLDAAIDSFLFMVHQKETEEKMDGPQSQNRFFDAVSRMLLDFPDELERNLYIEAIVKEYGRFGITSEGLRRRVGTLSLKGRYRTPEEDESAFRRQSPHTPKEAPSGEDAYYSAMSAEEAENQEAYYGGDDPPPYGSYSPSAGEGAGHKKPRGRERDGADKIAQKLVLTWLVNKPKIYETVARYITPGDFTEPLYSKVAAMVFRDCSEGNMNPARLLNAFTVSEEQAAVAGLFNAHLHLDGDEQADRAFQDAIIRIREDSLKKKNDEWDPKDLAALQKLIKEKQELEKLKQNRAGIRLPATS